MREDHQSFDKFEDRNQDSFMNNYVSESEIKALLSQLEQLKVKGKLPSKLASALFKALSTSQEEVEKLEDDNMRLMKDLEGEEQMEFLSEALKRSQEKVEKLKDTHVGKNLVELTARSVEMTPLHYALQEGQTSVVHYLLEKRANPVNLSHLFFQDRVNSSDLGLTPGASSDEDPLLVIDEQPGGAVLRPYDELLFKNSFCPALC
ncbi:hypothetical protein QYM36_003299 [Artemia franciscana]|uniref:Uncharacterized protein n=1 Tax=Artemia franciscana TaxID=6661 RepID=A0AA88L962_ARTSF|nr:hypothetical protein QYM36_003299 [Artemia franciscana]